MSDKETIEYTHIKIRKTIKSRCPHMTRIME